MAKELTTVVNIAGNLENSLRDTIQKAQKQIDRLGDSTKKATDAYGKMQERIEEQSDALKAAQRAYANYILSGDKSSKQAREAAKRVKDLSAKLQDSQDAMDAADRAAKALADQGLDKVEDAAKDTGEGFTVLKGALSDFISDGVQNLIGMAGDAASSIYGLADSTREFRQDMNTLTTAYDASNFSAEQATDTWRNLYAIFGEDDRAVEAANNIARIADSQAELDEWTRITAGIWGTYQDALPVESLAEAAAETINTGTVTGALADALNWSSEAAEMFSGYMSKDVVTAEDAFNVALSKCSTEAERNVLITETLTALYGDAADKYNETAGSIIEANKATADFSLLTAEAGERIEPVTTAVQSGFSTILEKVLELTEGVDFGAIADRVEDGFAFIADEAIPAVLDLKDNLIDLAENGIGWVKDNADWLIPVVSGLTAGFVAYKAITLGVAAAEAIKNSALVASITTMGVAQTATMGLGAAVSFLTSPITIAVAAVAALTAGVIWLYNNWDVAKEKLEQFGAKVSEIWGNISGWITGAIDTIGQYFPIFGGYLSGWWESIQQAVDNVKAIFQGVIDFIGNVFAGNWEAAWTNIKDIFGNIFGMIVNLAKAPINGVISAINTVINGINSISISLPDWLPGDLAGMTLGFNIPTIPMLATGGFTDGVSIAGEAGTEAVISFDRRYREANLGYWAKAGRLLGATADDAGFSLSGNPGGTTVLDMGGVTFAPNISINGNADKESVIQAIRDEYPEFLDLLEEWLDERGLPVYG